MKEILRKLSSRKLWAAVAGLVAGLAIAFGLDENIIASVSGAVVSVVSLVSYIVTEGKIDAAAVGNTVQAVQDAVQTIKDADVPDLDGAELPGGAGAGGDNE